METRPRVPARLLELADEYTQLADAKSAVMSPVRRPPLNAASAVLVRRAGSQWRRFQRPPPFRRILARSAIAAPQSRDCQRRLPTGAPGRLAHGNKRADALSGCPLVRGDHPRSS